MPDLSAIQLNSFRSGWTPSDDSINGRKDGLLQMDNVELDSNGALRMIGGTSVKWSGFTSNAHSIYSRVLNGTRHEYTALADGSIMRDSTLIGSGGDSSVAGFGTAFNYVLACSGNTRKKDNGAATVDLGVGAPTNPLTYDSINQPYAIAGTLLTNTVMYTGASAIITSATYPSGGGHSRPASIQYLQVTADANGQAVVQNTSAVGALDLSSFAPLFVGDPTGIATDDDVFPFYGYLTNPWGCSLQIDILLVAPNNFGDQVSDYYSYKIDDISNLQFDPFTGVFSVFIKRSDFLRFGSLPVDWKTTYGVRVSFQGTNGQVINLLGTTPNPLVGSSLLMLGGSCSQNGMYQFVQVNVNNTGSYQAKSPMGPISKPYEIVDGQIRLKVQTPVDSQVNEVWIYARSTGGENSIGLGSVLDKWYRVAVILQANFGNFFQVTMSDLDALTLNIFFDQTLVSIASSSITDKIISIVGPINGRWFYFTTNMMYPSDINNPDLVCPNLAVRTTGSASELFLWAFEVAEGIVLVGTSVNAYILSGTFQTLPDFTIDIYYRGVGCKYPPITYDAAIFNGSVVYLASDGWRSISASGENRTLVAPNTDLLYKGEARYGYSAPNLKIAPGSVRFPVCIGKNKLWCFITGTNRGEVWDFVRQYWRTFNYNLGDATAAAATQDGQIVAFYSRDAKIREIDISSSKLIDGVTQQTISILFPIFDGQTPKQRKDSCTLKLRLKTGGASTLNAYLSTESNTNVSVVNAINSSSETVVLNYDLSQITNLKIVKTYQLLLSGSAPDFLMADAEILYTLRPPQVSFLRLLPNNWGSAARKRLRTWPHVLDTLGNDVIFTPDIDGAIQSTTTKFNSSYKKTFRHYFKTDVTGVDYGGTLYCSSGLFEYFTDLPPEIVQIYPVAKQFDQLGPEELFRYGKIQKVRFRILPVNGSSIPYTVYFHDLSKQIGSFAVTPNIDATYEINMPKGVSGDILRLELGPTDFDFHRFYTQILVIPHGNDTENRWINLQ